MIDLGASAWQETGAFERLLLSWRGRLFGLPFPAIASDLAEQRTGIVCREVCQPSGRFFQPLIWLRVAFCMAMNADAPNPTRADGALIGLDVPAMQLCKELALVAALVAALLQEFAGRECLIHETSARRTPPHNDMNTWLNVDIGFGRIVISSGLAAYDARLAC